MARFLPLPAREPERGTELALVGDRRPLTPVINTRYGARDFLTLLFKEKRLLLVAFAATMLLATIVSFIPSVKYTANSRLLVLMSREYTFRPQVGAEGGPTMSLENSSIIRSEIEILSNPALKRTVIDRIGVDRLYPGLADEPPATELEGRKQMDAAVKNFTANMKIAAIKDSNVVHVSFAHPDPQLAADVLNLLVQTFLDSRRTVYGESGSAFLVNERDDFAARLAEAEKAMESFKLRNDITVLDEQKLLLLRNQAELETTRRDTVNRLREVTAQVENLNSSMARVPRTVPLYSETTSTAAVESAKSRLLELQLRRNELMAKYTANSRFVRDVNQQIAFVQQFLAQEGSNRAATQRVGPNPTYEDLSAESIRLRAEADALRARQVSIDTQLAEMDRRRASMEQLERQYRELALNREILEQQYQAYAAKAEEARILEDLDRRQAANIRIIEKAVPPTQGRNLQPLILLLGIVAGLLTALAAALLREFTRTTLVTPEAAERALGLPVLVAVPLKGPDAASPLERGGGVGSMLPTLPRRRAGKGLGSRI